MMLSREKFNPLSLRCRVVLDHFQRCWGIWTSQLFTHVAAGRFSTFHSFVFLVKLTLFVGRLTIHVVENFTFTSVWVAVLVLISLACVRLGETGTVLKTVCVLSLVFALMFTL